MAKLHADSISYKKLEALLQKDNVLLSVSEVHGLQSGICTAIPYAADSHTWFSILSKELGSDNISKKTFHTLKAIYAYSQHSLQDLSFSFMPLLPELEISLVLRARELAAWCRGFLCGLSLAGFHECKAHTGLMHEAIQDISEIAYLNFEESVGVDNMEEAEVGYMELVEFVRVAAQTVYVELRQALSGNGMMVIPDETLH